MKLLLFVRNVPVAGSVNLIAMKSDINFSCLIFLFDLSTWSSLGEYGIDVSSDAISQVIELFTLDRMQIRML